MVNGSRRKMERIMDRKNNCIEGIMDSDEILLLNEEYIEKG